MKKNETIKLIELFNNYNDEELCAFYELFNAYDNKEMNILIKEIYKAKTNKELTSEKVFGNEELSLEIICNKINELSSENLLLLDSIIKSASYLMFEDPDNSINKKYDDSYIVYLKFSIDIINEFIDNEINKRKRKIKLNIKKKTYNYNKYKVDAILSNITFNQLIKMFNNYDVFELEYLKNMFDSVQDYSINEISKVIKRVIENKYEEYQKEFSVPINNKIINYSTLSSKNSILEKNELELLHMVTSLLINYLNKSKSLENTNYESQYTVNNNELKHLINYNNSLNDEINSRNKQLVLK